LVAVAVVIGSACTALHYSTTSQNAVTISNNPYHYPTGGSQTFIVAPAGSGDHDILQDIYLDACTSQWTLDTSIDAQQPVLGAHVCGFGTGSGSGFITADESDLIFCPRNYQFAVYFAGTQTGMSSCNVQISSVDYIGSASNKYTLMLTGSGSAPTGIDVMPKEIDYGDVQLGMPSTQPVTVTNLGSAFITVNGVLNAPGFQVSPSPASFGLGSGSSATFNVTCAPTVEGGLAGSLDFTTAGSSGSTTLSCNGIDSSVTVAPTPVRFANTLVGRAPPNKSIQITGATSAYIEYITLDSEAMANGVTFVANPQMMTVGSGQEVVLAYDAAAMHPSGPLGTMSLKFSVDASPRTVAISGEALVGGIGTNPASVELGAVCAGDTVSKDVEVYASEPGSVVVQNLTKPAAPFDTTVTDTLPKTLAGNHTGPSLNVHVTIAPTAPGDFMDAVALNSDVPNKPTTEVQLHGIALAAGIAATPDVVHFGATAPGTTTSIKQVQLTNCGATELMFSGASITGEFASEFTLIGANPPRTLLPTESELFMVVMQPDTAGFKTAQLVIQHSEGATTVDLDGTGDGGSPKDRETYYACSTGRGAALWPIALALLALRRRRR
jgi:MYXO-CTERM domain-containing protein